MKATPTAATWRAQQFEDANPKILRRSFEPDAHQSGPYFRSDRVVSRAEKEARAEARRRNGWSALWISNELKFQLVHHNRPSLKARGQLYRPLGRPVHFPAEWERSQSKAVLDTAKRDFRLKAGSPARKTGYEDLPFGEIGIRK